MSPSTLATTRSASSSRKRGGVRAGSDASGRAARRISPVRLLARLLALALSAFLVAAALHALGVLDPAEEAFERLTLPLKHEDIIRQQAADKDLDPALIAAVAYEESRFRDRTSHAGAKGLMQITPDTARFIARHSGGTSFVLDDLATPQVNIAYGAWYLRYLAGLYDGDETLALAAYNAGERNADRWVAAAGGIEDFDPAEDIRFAETREYVLGVIDSRKRYRRLYPRELGL